jgi:hypothetical protein
VRFDFLYKFYVKDFFILRRIQRDIIINVHRSSSKVLVIFVRFEWNLNTLDRLLKNIQISNFMKIRSVGAELFHTGKKTDGRTDITKLIVTFRNFAKAHKNMSYKVGNTVLFNMPSSYPSTLENSSVYTVSNVTLPVWIRI